MAVGEWLQKIINDKTLSFIGWNDATRDLFKESAALFRELCEKRVYDMNYALNLFDPIKAYNSAMQKSTYASLMSKYEPAYAKKVAALTEKLETVGAPYKD